MAKEIARLPLGADGGASFLYWSDLNRQWENAIDPTKVLQLIGTQGAPATAVPDLRDWLGELTEAERALEQGMRRIYKMASRMATTLDVAVDPTPDILETLLDFRILGEHVRFPCRVLDIGPGAGRHLLGLLLDAQRAKSVYVGIESIGLPYLLQNLLGSCLNCLDNGVRFHEAIDSQFARRPFAVDDAAEGTAWHLPLWGADSLPSASFDVILCSYLLDELSDVDFVRVLDLIDRCLAPGGIVYCRGSQQRACTRELFEFGYGTYHQHDITASLRARSLLPCAGGLTASTLTRILKRGDADPEGDALLSAPNDATALAVAQDRVIADNLAEIRERGLRTVVWDKLSCRTYRRFIEPHRAGVDIVAFTNESAGERRMTDFGVPEVPLAELKALAPDVVIVCSMGEYHPLRRLREALGPDALPRLRRLMRPIAFAYTA